MFRFLVAILGYSDTIITSAQPEAAEEAIKNRRAMPAPTILIFVPTMTSTIGTGKPVSYMVRQIVLHQIRTLHHCLPLEGKVSAQPTDEVKFKSAAASIRL